MKISWMYTSKKKKKRAIPKKKKKITTIFTSLVDKLLLVFI